MKYMSKYLPTSNPLSSLVAILIGMMLADVRHNHAYFTPMHTSRKEHGCSAIQ